MAKIAEYCTGVIVELPRLIHENGEGYLLQPANEMAGPVVNFLLAVLV